MENTVNAEYIWTSDEYLTAYKYHWRSNFRTFFRWALHIIAVLAMIGAGAKIYSHGFSILGVLLLLGGFYWLFIRRFDVAWTIKRKFKKRPDRDKKVEVSFSDTVIRIKIEGIGKSDLEWNAFVKAIHSPKGMLLYPNEGIFNWVPFTGFQSEEDTKTFIRLTQEKIGTYKKVA